MNSDFLKNCDIYLRKLEDCVDTMGYPLDLLLPENCSSNSYSKRYINYSDLKKKKIYSKIENDMTLKYIRDSELIDGFYELYN
jgi:hypothetical protein